MTRGPGPRPFRRRNDGILIFLHPDAWISDVPLPEGSTIVEMGEDGEIPFYPQWHFTLRPDRTIEMLAGWFKVPLSLEDAVDWYRVKMRELGWVEGPKEGHFELHSAGLNFQHSETNAKLEISIRRWPHKQETTAMIRRVVVHPWAPAEGEWAGEPVESTGVHPRQLEEPTEVEEALPLEEVPVAVQEAV